MQIFHEIRNYKDGFMVWNCCYENMRFLAHWHREIELIYVRRGSTQVSVDGVFHLLHQGDLLICDSRSVHYSDFLDASNEIEFLLFDPHLILPGYLSRHNNVHFTAEKLAQAGLTEPLQQMLALVNAELQARNSHYQKIVQSAITAFWYGMLRFCPPKPEQKQEVRLQKLEAFLEYMQEHFREEITLQFAAETLDLTPSYFSAYFKKNVGINFIAYLQTIRIEAAVRRLQSRKEKIIDVALDCGFANIRSFNRVFRDLTGTTPMALQKSNPSDYSVPMFSENDGQALNVEYHSSVVVLT